MSAVEVGVPRGHGPTGPPEGGSLSSMGGRTPPATPKKAGGKMLAVKILMLDDTYTLFQIQSKALGAVLLEQTCRQLNLLESDYFGLEYTDGNTRYWLDLDKPMNRQVCLSQGEPVLRFCVKFYTPDPAQLEEEYTRYLFALQIKRDLSHGELHCNENTAALMASYIVQAECGDYVEEDYPDHRYLSLFKFIPSQDDDMERKIMENHKKHIGMTPAAADLNLLETARRCELYGIKMHPAKDHENVLLNLAAAHMGILVFQNHTKINTFSWAKIRKISFKRKRFLIKLHPEGYGTEGYYKDVVEFFFDGRNECKNFWKKCVEHHGFFRCSMVKKLPRQKTRVLSRGSSFRYSGRTQKQVQDYVRDNYIKRQPFQRSQSFRHSPNVHTNVANVGMSISAQPLIPLRDNQCVGTPVSLSCGSMTLPSTGDTHSPGSPTQTETVDSREYDLRELETPSMTPSRQETLSPETSITSSPHRSATHDGGTVATSTPKPPTSSPGSVSPILGTPTPFTQSHQKGLHSPPSVPKFISPPKVPPHSQPPEEEPPLQKSLPENSLNHSQLSPNHVINRDQSLLNGHEKNASPARISDGEEAKKRKYPTDRAYFIVKEMLTTERTYKKDLEVISVWFRLEVKKEVDVPEETLNQLFLLIDNMYEFHCKFLKELDNRLAQWDGRSSGASKAESQRIGDLMLKYMDMLEVYQQYFEQHGTLLENIESAFRKNKKFEQIYRDFETQKVCYLPLTSFLLKPLHRLQHYHALVVRLIQHYGSVNHPDYKDCMSVKAKLHQCIKAMIPSLTKSENLVKMMELQRDLIGIDNLVQPGREFLREGCLQKLSRKGYQQRMFFLFNDVLLYTNRTTTPILQFKVHGQLPLRGVMVEENESRMGATNCFTIYGGNRALMVAANSEEDKSRWLEDLSAAISNARSRQDVAFHYLSLKSISTSDEVLDKSEVVDEMQAAKNEKTAPQTRSNTTVHVCWHRATSVSAKDYTTAVQNQLSGYLLRKFKNSMGWQKLWVVFTNFCLFFYKTFQDEFPLASLPLLGYTISTPGEDDQIQKEFVFKLQFKNHVYFFRAESEYTFSRWMEVIASATKGSARNRIFSRKESDTTEVLST